MSRDVVARLITRVLRTIDVSSDYACSLSNRFFYGGLFLPRRIVPVVGLPSLCGYLDRCVRESLQWPRRFRPRPAAADDYVAGLKVASSGFYYFLVTVIGVTYFFSNVAAPAGSASTGSAYNTTCSWMTSSSAICF